ncbi:MAG: lytic transglycosylase domain-containing protein [Candidatus Cloacimonetes bacterium]|nr:lytic transglycosylase domain-containing protein [Candidatus Cloacimonadota bacterium]
MKFVLKFILCLSLINCGFFYLAKKSNSLENQLLKTITADEFNIFTPLKFENPQQQFTVEKEIITKKINYQVNHILSKKSDKVSFISRLNDAEVFFQKDKFQAAEMAYSKVFSSLYTLQKIQDLSRVDIGKIEKLSFVKTYLPTTKFITGAQLYRLIKLQILMKRVDCLIRLKRLHKMFFLLNLSYKLDEFSVIEKHFQQKQLFLLYPRPYYTIIEKISKKFDVDIGLIYAIMREETHFNERAKSHAGALGLMQLMPKTAKELHHEISIKFPGLFKSKFNTSDLFRFELNIIYGVYYLSKLKKRYKGQLQYMVAAYNAGPAPVKRWKKCSNTRNTLFEDCVGYKETSSYLERVLGSYQYYQKIYN